MNARFSRSILGAALILSLQVLSAARGQTDLRCEVLRLSVTARYGMAADGGNSMRAGRGRLDVQVQATVLDDRRRSLGGVTSDGAEWSVILDRDGRNLRWTANIGFARIDRTIDRWSRFLYQAPRWYWGYFSNGMSSVYEFLVVRRLELGGEPAWGPSIADLDAKAIVRLAHSEYRKAPEDQRAGIARFIAQLGVFVDLESAGIDESAFESIAESASEPENSGIEINPMPQRAGRRRRFAVPNYQAFDTGSIEQAAVVAGYGKWMPADPMKPRDGGGGNIGLWRCIAENPSTRPDARVVAMQRVLPQDNRIELLDDWIAAIETGEMSLQEPFREEMLHLLKEKASGREILSIFSVGGAVMGGLLLAIVLIRRLTFRIATG